MSIEVSEQRCGPRFRMDAAARVIVESSTGLSARCQGRVQEISSRGMMICLRHELSVGRLLRVALTLPGEGLSLSFRARVRNRRGDCYGVELMELGDVEGRWLDDACNRLAVTPPMAS